MKCPKCRSDNPDTQTFCGDCGTRLDGSGAVQPSFTRTIDTPLSRLTEGTIFASRYEILGLLGAGGMGEVYKACDTELNEIVALKLLKPEIASDQRILDRFRNELKLARKITHESVCRMHELMVFEGAPFLTMEFVDGEDLKSYIRHSDTIEKEVILAFARQITEGMAQAFKLGVVHRDLKPQNIMVLENGAIKIMDFGIARSIGTRGVTEAGQIIGTPDYMSPEQAEGEETDQRSDIYSLGIILYEMATGQVPFEADSIVGVVMKHKNEAPLHPQKLNPSLPSGLAQIILRCLEKVPEDRYQSPDDLLQDLRLRDKGLPPAAKTSSKSKNFFPALAAILLIVVAALIWRPWAKDVSEPITLDRLRVAVLYFNNNTANTELDFYRKVFFTNLITDLSQSTLFSVLTDIRTHGLLEAVGQLDASIYSEAKLHEIAQKGNISHFVMGDYAESGDDFWVNIRIFDVRTQEIIGGERIDGDRDSIPDMIDRMTWEIKPFLGLTAAQIDTDIDENLRDITTSSPEALRLYSEAMTYRQGGDAEKAIDLFENAISLDPDFAMAYWIASGIYQFHLSRFAKASEYRKKANKLRHKLSPKERLFFEAKGGADRIAAHEKLLDLYPEFVEAGISLAVMYMNLGEWEKTVEIYEPYIRDRVDNRNVYGNAAINYCFLGNYDRARELRIIEKQYGGKGWLADIYLSEGKYDLAWEDVNKNSEIGGFWNLWLPVIRGDIHYLQGNILDAEHEYRGALQKGLETTPLYLYGRLRDLYVLQGRFDDALLELQKAGRLAKDLNDGYLTRSVRNVTAETMLAAGDVKGAWEYHKANETSSYVLAEIYLGLNELIQAESLAHELGKQVDHTTAKRTIRNQERLLGLIELKKTNHSEAITHFEKAVSLLPFEKWHESSVMFIIRHCEFIDPLAKAYYESGDLDKAEKQYQRILALTTGRLHFGDIYAKAHFMLGNIYAQQNDNSKAIENYQKFIDIWKDCDPQFQPMVEDARKQVDLLRN